MKATLIFTLMTIVCFAQANNYYLSFIEAAGINVKSSSDADCAQLVSDALSNVKDSFGQQFTDIDVLLGAMVTFVDTMKSEINPVCRDLSTDFESFLNKYSGDAEALKEQAEDNLDENYFAIGQDLTEASNSLAVGEESEAGKLHGKVFRTLLGLDKEEAAPVEAETKPAAATKKTSEDASEDVFGEVYRAYIHEITILNSASDDVSSDNSSEKEAAPTGYVSSLINRFQQIRKGATAARQLQEKSGYNAYNMEL